MEKGQGSEEEMASLKKVKAEFVRDVGILLMISCECKAYRMRCFEMNIFERRRRGIYIVKRKRGEIT